MFELVRELQRLGIVKFGEFTLRTGAKSSFYIDFRETLSHPKLFKRLGSHMAELSKNLNFDVIGGVPYAAIPLATSVALNTEMPLLLCRKEAKAYGQKKIIDGLFSRGQKCLLIEDVITTGASILDTAEILRREGLVVDDCLSLVCRQEEARINLAKADIALHTVFQMEQLLEAI